MRSVSPEKWHAYEYWKSQGYTYCQAARLAGISRKAARNFEDRNPTSSGTRWLIATRGRT